MMSDSAETRLGRLETGMAKLEQRVDDLSIDVRALTPLVVAVAEVKFSVGHVQEDVKDTKAALQDIVKRLDEDAKDRQKGQAERAKEARAGKYVLWAALIAATAAILASIVGAAAVLLG